MESRFLLSEKSSSYVNRDPKENSLRIKIKTQEDEKGSANFQALENSHMGLNDSPKYRRKNSNLIRLEHEICHSNANSDDKNCEFRAINGEDDTGDGINCKFVENGNLLMLGKAGKKYKCCVCGKKFRGMKRLSGHMRCHPERNWRGIRPPPAVKKIFTSTLPASMGWKKDDPVEKSNKNTMMERPVYHHMPSLSTWSARRRRKISAPVNDPEAIPNCIENLDAVYNLLMLARGDPLELFEKKQVTVKSEERNTDLVPNKSRNFKGENVTEKLDLKCTNMVSVSEVTDGSRDLKQNGTELESQSHIHGKKKVNYMAEISKNEKKNIRGREIRTLKSVGSGRYTCSTCNKSFPSHQALGGHRSSHRKENNRSVVIGVGKFEEGDDDFEDGGYMISDPAPLKGNPDSDNTLRKAITPHCCNTALLTGDQLLRGHQRNLCNKSPVQAPLSSALQETDDEEIGRPLHGFDLNELPTVDDNEFLNSAPSPCPELMEFAPSFTL